MTCPACTIRPYLCFDCTEDARALECFATRWAARVARDAAFAAELAKAAWFAGRKVAKGELLLARAHDMLAAKAAMLDDTLPGLRYTRILGYHEADPIVAAGFAAGKASVRGR